MDWRVIFYRSLLGAIIFYGAGYFFGRGVLLALAQTLNRIGAHYEQKDKKES